MLNPGLSLLNLGSSYSESVALENSPSLPISIELEILAPRAWVAEEPVRTLGPQSIVAWGWASGLAHLPTMAGRQAHQRAGKFIAFGHQVPTAGCQVDKSWKLPTLSL